ncbi:MAG: nitroreductase family protein [FCB group bacterium]|jgi:nitroreductase
MSMSKEFIKYDYHKRSLKEIRDASEAYYKLMLKRRSVREFSTENVPDEIIENIIKTAGTAPSGANKQPWFFCLVRNPEIKHQIRMGAEKIELENYTQKFTEDFLKDVKAFGTNFQKEFLDVAPALIVIFKEKYKIVNEKIEKNYFVTESTGIAVGLLIAAIHNAGLVTLPYSPSPNKFLNEILDRPENESPFIILPIGFPKEGVGVPNNRRKELNEIMKVY